MPIASVLQSTHFLARVTDTWAYVTLAASGIITEELAPILGGIAAHEGHLRITRVIVAVAVGTWLATLGIYAIGRWRSRWVTRRWHISGGKFRRMIALVRLRPWYASALVRWAFGARIALPLACGVARVPLVTYAVASGISTLAWSALFGVLGWIFGESAAVALAHARRVLDWSLVGALVAGVAVAVVIWWRKGKRDTIAEP